MRHYIIILFTFSLLSCSEIKTKSIDIDAIYESTSFKNFQQSSFSLNNPIIESTSIMDEGEILELSDRIESFNSQMKNSSNIEFDALLREIGYSDYEEYANLVSDYERSFIKLTEEHPEINGLSEEELRSLFITLFTKEINLRHKSLGDCTYDYSYCVSMAEGTFYAGTGICALSALGSPITALACQAINAALFHGSLGSCLNDYNNCTFSESPAKIK